MQCNTYILIHLLHFSSSTSVVAASLPSWQWPVGDCSAVPCRVRRPSPAWASVSVDCVQFSVLHSDPSVHQHHHTPHSDTPWAGAQPSPTMTTAAEAGAQRPALVGRRFLSVTGSSCPKLKTLYDWDWRAGWIRSSSSTDSRDPELQVSCCTSYCDTPRVLSDNWGQSDLISKLAKPPW